MPPYSPWTWIEKVTQVGPTRMNAIETGLADASAVAYAAVPKSVAVADQDLIIGTGSGTVGRKAKGADGSWLRMAGGVLVWDTIDPQDISGYPADATKYLAGDATWKTIGTVGYGTALPGSPTDGQEYILVDSTTAPTYQWRFRYNNGSSGSYKWEFVGGVPMRALVATAETVSSTTYADLATAGPSITVPRAGIYLVRHGVWSQVAAGTFAMSSVKIGAAATSDAQAAYSSGTQSAGNYWFSQFREQEITFAASDVAKLQYRYITATWVAVDRWLSITPIRVS